MKKLITTKMFNDMVRNLSACEGVYELDPSVCVSYHATMLHLLACYYPEMNIKQARGVCDFTCQPLSAVRVRIFKRCHAILREVKSLNLTIDRFEREVNVYRSKANESYMPDEWKRVMAFKRPQVDDLIRDMDHFLRLIVQYLVKNHDEFKRKEGAK